MGGVTTQIAIIIALFFSTLTPSLNFNFSLRLDWTGLVLVVLCGLVFLSVLVTIVTIEILTKRQAGEEESNNRTNTEANTTEFQAEKTTMAMELNISSTATDISEDKTSTAEPQIEGDTTTSHPVTDDEAEVTELQVEDTTSELKISTSSPEENEETDEETDNQMEAFNNYDIQSSLEDYEYDNYPYSSSSYS